MKEEIETTLIFVRGGFSSKNNKPYLSCSNGKETFFVNIPKKHNLAPDVFDDYEEDDDITLRVSLLVGSPTVTLLEVIEQE